MKLETRALSWSLVIATYNRLDVLLQCARFALAQTRRPSEIIIVDASKSWKVNESVLREQLARSIEDIKLVYVSAQVASLTNQRNQGIKLSTSEVVFLFDDDTFMYPDCAEEILKIYELDYDETVIGVQAGMLNSPPDFIPTNIEQKTAVRAPDLPHAGRVLQLFFSIIKRHVFLFDANSMFIPYNIDVALKPIPPHIAKLDIRSEKLFHGCRMTFRRRIFLSQNFNSILLSYCPGEDLDFSHRASSLGHLVTALRAGIYHHEAKGGRINRFQATLLSALNQAFLIRNYATDLKKPKADYDLLMKRRILAEFLKDLLSRRWNFPQLRGIISALKRSQEVFSCKSCDLSVRYTEIQKEILQN